MAGVRKALIAVALCLLCAGCPPRQPPPAPPGDPVPSPSASPPAAAADPTLRWAIGEPSAIIPIDATTPDDLLVVDALFDSLTRWGPRGDVRRSVARRWRPSNGGRTWTFTVRPTARFSDGTRVTPASFVRTWTALARRGRAHHHLQDVVGYDEVRRGQAVTLAGVSAPERATLKVRLTRPLAQFPAVVAHPALAPMKAVPPASAAETMPVGNGPFRMAEPWARGDFVRLTRAGEAERRDPLRGTPLHEVVFQVQDPASAYIAYEQGGVDVVTIPPIALTAADPPAGRIAKYRGPGLLRGPLPSTYFLTCNTARPPCAGVRARRGLTLALDRRRIAGDVFYRSAGPAVRILPPPVPASRPRACDFCRHDPARARQLLERAGVERTRLWISEAGDHERVARRIQADLFRVGVSSVIKTVPFDRFLSALRRGEPGLFRFGWTLDYPTGDSALRPLFHSDGAANYGTYRADDVDALLDAAAAQRAPRRRNAAYRAAEDLILGRDQAVIPVAALRRRTIVAPRVRNLVYGPMGTVDLAAVRILERVEGE